MRNLLVSALVIIGLISCGGGGNTENRSGELIHTGSLSGIAFDGLISNGTVNVYSFSSGAKGSLLGQTNTDSNGIFSLSIKAETTPLLIEVTNGSYAEEAGFPGNMVTLNATQKLTTLINYTTGTSLNIAVTSFTHLAAGLAEYGVKNGAEVTGAIDSANDQISNLAGVSIIKTIPKQITDVNNLSFSLTSELKYGFLAGAISQWVSAHNPPGVSPLQVPFTSIAFAQTMYEDILADGLLDGMGVDSTGAPLQLSFGVTALSVDVYRKELATSILQIANSSINKTGLTVSNVLEFAQNYISNTVGIYNSVTPVPFSSPVVAITSQTPNSWVSRIITIAVQITDEVGVVSSELFVDNGLVFNIAGDSSASLLLDTTKFSNGLHNVSVRSKNVAGIATITTIPLRIDNASPLISSQFFSIRPALDIPQGEFIFTAADVDSGINVNSVTSTTGGMISHYIIGGIDRWSFPIAVFVTDKSKPYDTYSISNFSFTIRDNQNNCTTRTYTTAPLESGSWSNQSGPCS